MDVDLCDKGSLINCIVSHRKYFCYHMWRLIKCNKFMVPYLNGEIRL